MSNQKMASFLGLDKNELEVVNLLKRGKSWRPIDITRNCSVKRTTTNYVLKQLLSRGIVSRVKIKGHYEWRFNDYGQVKNRLDSLHNFYSKSVASGIINIPENIGVEVLLGKENMLKAYKRLLRISKGDRLYAIQGNKSVLAADQLGQYHINYIQDEYRKRGIILEGIIGYSSLDYLKKLSSKDLKVYKNRLVVVGVIDDEFIDFDMDIIIHSNLVMMINYGQELILIIKNEFIKKAIFNLYQSLKAISRKIDLNKFIEEIIDNKK